MVGGSYRLSDDAFAEARREALDLSDHRCCRVTRIALGHMLIRPHRMHVADGSLRVGQILLTDQDLRPLGHAAGMDVPLR